ncbi:MAG: hypothetical protein Q4P05_06100 [Actinomycetaceae bacterium]|nr:hypothetical protein [Actinomycetaceae bacterium]
MSSLIIIHALNCFGFFSLMRLSWLSRRLATGWVWLSAISLMLGIAQVVVAGGMLVDQYYPVAFAYACAILTAVAALMIVWAIEQVLLQEGRAAL